MKEDKKIGISSDDVYKWIVLGCFCLNSFSNIILFTGLSPIWSMTAIYYSTTDYNLNWLTNMYYLPFIATTFFLNLLINKYFGLSQILSCCCTTFGLWLLLMVKQNFLLSIICFVFIGFGEALYYQVPLHLSKIWFPHEERIISTFIAQYSNNVGMLAGYTGCTIYFYNIVDQVEFNIRYEKLILFNAVLATISLVCSFAFLKQPKTQLVNLQIRETIFGSLKKIFQAEESFFDLLSVSSFIGLGWCYTMLFGNQQYLARQTFDQVYQTSIAFQFGQIIAAGICTWRLQRYSQRGIPQNFDFFIKGAIRVGYWALVIEILVFESIPFIMLLFLNIVIGAGLGGLYSILLESLMEKHFPVQELTIGSILASVSSLISLVITMAQIIPQFLQFGFQISCYLMIIPFCYISVFYKTQFKRFEFEA